MSTTEIHRRGITMRIVPLSTLLLAAAVLVGCEPAQQTDCASQTVRSIANDPSAVRCAPPEAHVNGLAVAAWVHCVLGGLREGRSISAHPLYVLHTGGRNYAYVANRQGPDMGYGACPRIILREYYPGRMLVSCGTPEHVPFNAFGYRLVYPHRDQDILRTIDEVRHRMRNVSPDLPPRIAIVDFPEALDPAGDFCRFRTLHRPEAEDPGSCGLLVAPGWEQPDVRSTPYAGWNCHAMEP